VGPRLGRMNDFSISLGGTVIAEGNIADGSSSTRSAPLNFASALLLVSRLRRCLSPRERLWN
jgi:hypothetical protein